MTTAHAVGDLVTLEIGSVAHGGICVARLHGQVVFVRGTMPGERVVASITAAPEHGRFMRADTVEVLQAAAGRVTPPCKYADACGGCDWQHVSLHEQRLLKAAIVQEQLVRVAKEPEARWAGLEVEAVPGDTDGLHWRTRMRYAVDPDGRAGLHPPRSHDVLEIDECLLATQPVSALDVTRSEWPGAQAVLAIGPSDSPPLAMPDPRPGQARVTERAVGRHWTFDATAFWQVHPGAPDALAAAVCESLSPRAGEHAIDLYSGVGLFAGALASPLGPGGRIDAVESDPVAMQGARRSLHDLPTVHLHEQRVDHWLRSTPLRRCDLVVLDPPRKGAGADVIERVISKKPRAIAYVACDPVAMARDLATAKARGWRLEGLRSFDCFPMTHHVECVALLVPDTVTS